MMARPMDSGDTESFCHSGVDMTRRSTDLDASVDVSDPPCPSYTANQQ